MTRPFTLFLLTLTLLAAACGRDARQDADSPAGGGSRPFTLTVLHVNDTHSHLDGETATLLLDTGGGRRQPVLAERGGFARVCAAIRALEAGRPNPIKIHSGDVSTGDLYFTLTQGKADAELMNAVCFDALVAGNHEFDNGDAGLKRLIDFLHASPGCATPVLSANARFGADSPLAAARAPGAVRPSTVLVRQGERIGVIGLTVAGKTKQSSRPDAGTTFLDEAGSAQAEIDRLTALGVNKIILATHIGYPADQALARRLRGVDVVVGGDSHSLLGPEVLRRYGLSPEGPYPTRTTDLDGRPVCIVQAWQYALAVGELAVEFTPTGEVSRCQGGPLVLIGEPYRHADNQPLDPEELAAVRADIAAGGVLRPTEPDPRAEALLAPYRAEKQRLGATVIAEATDSLCLRRVPGSRRDPSRSTLGDACNASPRVNAHGGDIQQLVAEAFLDQGRRYFQADLSLINGGGVRIDLAPGPVTVKDLYAVLPFKNTLVQLNCTGAEIKAALEDAVEAVVSRNSTGSYPYAAGLRWHLDLGKPKGSRFFRLEVRGSDGLLRPLEPRRTYRVATLSFLADGNDSFTTLGQVGGERRIDVGLDATGSFLAYIEALPGSPRRLAVPPAGAFSTQRFIDTP